MFLTLFIISISLTSIIFISFIAFLVFWKRQKDSLSTKLKSISLNKNLLEEKILWYENLDRERRDELATQREAIIDASKKISNLERELDTIGLSSVLNYKKSIDFKELLEETRELAILDFKNSNSYQELLKGSIQHNFCEDIKRKALQELSFSYEERLKRESDNYKQLQEQFNFEKRYKNVSNIGDQLKEAIFDKLNESFLASGLIIINSNPPLVQLPGKRSKGVRTDILVEVLSPLQPSRKILTVVIEAKNQKPDTLEPQKNKRYFEQLFDQLEAYQADYALLVTELEPENNYLTIVPIENRDDVFMLRLSYLVGFLQILIRFAFKSEYYGQEHKVLKSRENLIRLIDTGRQEIEERQFRYVGDANKKIRDRCENIKQFLEDIDELTQKNDRRLKTTSKKLLSFYKEVGKEVKRLPEEGLTLLADKSEQESFLIEQTSIKKEKADDNPKQTEVKEIIVDSSN